MARRAVFRRPTINPKRKSPGRWAVADNNVRAVVATVSGASAGLNSEVVHTATGWVGSPNVGGGGLSTVKKVAPGAALLAEGTGPADTAKKVAKGVLKSAIGQAPSSITIHETYLWPKKSYSDDFNRANGALGSNWQIEGANTASIVSNNAIADSGVGATYFWNDTASVDQFSEVTLGTFTTASTGPLIFGQWDPVYSLGAFIYYSGSTWNYFFTARNSSGTAASFSGSQAGSAPVAGSLVRLEGTVNSSGIYIRGYLNGVLFLTKSQTGYFYSALAGGSPGIVFVDGSSRVDSWTGGDLYTQRPTAFGSPALSAAKKVGVASVFATTADAPRATGKKVSTPVATGAFGQTGNAAATRVASAVVAGLNALGALGSALATKIGVTASRGVVGETVTGVAGKKAPATGLAANGSSGLATARKSAPATGVAATEIVPLAAVKKSVVAILRAALGTSGLLAAKKVSTPSAAATTGNAQKASATKKSIVAALGEVATGALTSAVKRGLASGLGAAGHGPIGIVRKVRAATGSGALGTAMLATTKKVTPSSLLAALGTAGVASAVHRGRVFAAAESLASGLHQAFAIKNATPTVRETVGQAETLSAKKVSTPSVNGATGSASTVSAKKIGKAVATGSFGQVVRTVVSAVAPIYVVASGTFGVVVRSVAQKISPATGVEATGGSASSVARKRTAIAAIQRVGVASTGLTGNVRFVAVSAINYGAAVVVAAAKKVSTPSIRGLSGSVYFTNAAKRASVVAETDLEITPTSYASKASTGVASLGTGMSEHAAAAKTGFVQGLLAASSTGAASAVTSRVAAAVSSVALVARGVALKVATLGTHVLGEGNLGDDTLAGTGRTRGVVGSFLRALASAFIGSIPNVENGDIAVAVGEMLLDIDQELADVIFPGGEPDIQVDQEKIVLTPEMGVVTGELNLTIGD